MLLVFFLNVIFCLASILFRRSCQKHVPLSNNVPLIGHINFIVPVNNFVNDSILLSSVNGNVSLFDYKIGEHRWIRNHREEEKVKKLHGDKDHATVLIYRDSCEDGTSEIIEEDNNIHFYINVYDIVNSDLINVYEYREEIVDFAKKENIIVIVFKDRIEIGNVIENSIEYKYFKDMNIDYDFLYVKILQFDKNKNSVSLFCIEKTEAVPYIINININVSPQVKKITKIKELQLNRKRKHFIKIYDNHLILVYNKKFLYWIDILNWGESSYAYHHETITEQEEEELLKEEENTTNGELWIEAQEEAETEISNGGTFEKSDGHIVIDIFGDKIHYFYLKNNLKFVKNLKENETEGYYYKNGKKQLIMARDENGKIYIEEANTNEKSQTTLSSLTKSTNVLYNAELVIGIHNFIENRNYYLTVFKDSSFTVYMEKDPLYSREEGLAYIEQVYFYSFQHLLTDKKQRTYTWQLDPLKEIKKLVTEKIRMLNTSFNIEELINKKAERHSMLPFNLFYLKNEEKMKLLKISEDKKTNNQIFLSAQQKGDGKNDVDKEHKKKETFYLMNQLFNDVYNRVISQQSVKYSWNYIVLVSTLNGLIFAFHLSTGLILYKIDINQFKKENFTSLKHLLCSYDFSNNNWGEMHNGRKMIFLKNKKGLRKRTEYNNATPHINKTDSVHDIDKMKENESSIFKNESALYPFRMYSKDSFITVSKNQNSSTILIFDILNATALYKKHLPSFRIEHLFILPKSKALVLVDPLLNIRIINVLNKKITENINESELYFYNINTLTNDIRGYKIVSINRQNETDKGPVDTSDTIRTVETYKININEEELEVLAMSNTKKKKFFPAKINTNTTIQYKYLNNSLICYITKSLNAKKEFFYTLYIFDGAGGKYLFSKILDRFAEPPFHVMINENIVIVNYYHSNLNKYVIYVLELLLDKEDPGFLSIITSKKEKTVHLFHDTNVMITEKQYVIDYNSRSFNFTETKRGITNKHLILLLDTNKIAALIISDKYNRNFYRKINEYITNTNILYNSKGVVLNESSLESTTLVFSWGNYLFFTAYQPNGLFDAVENYNILFLILIIILVFVITFVSYLKRIDKKLHAHWA